MQVPKQPTHLNQFPINDRPEGAPKPTSVRLPTPPPPVSEPFLLMAAALAKQSEPR